jgi:hypothetical protein
VTEEKKRMGASAWEYFTPYQPDLEKAFRDLRQQVFDTGDYLLDTPSLPPTEEEYIRQAYRMGICITEEDEERHRRIYREMKAKYSKPTPRTIEELIEWNGESGTHTIIDVTYFTDDPNSNALFTAIPLSEAQLLCLFGTTKPTHSVVVEKGTEIRGLRQRSQAAYCIVYEGDEPAEIYFAGFSGD